MAGVGNKCRIQSLQSLRGYAFLLIFISHCSFLTGKTNYWGAFGVSLFIVLSGFLLVYNDTKIESVWRYVITKMKKIWPLHIVCLLATFPLVLGDSISKTMMQKIVLNVLCLQSFIPKSGFYFSLNSVAWYLSVFLLCLVFGKLIIRFTNFTIEKSGIRGGVLPTARLFHSTVLLDGIFSKFSSYALGSIYQPFLSSR